MDAGYPTLVGYIGLYRCERYHLLYFRHSYGFENHNKVFNYYNSSFRYTIERTFEVWKNRFAILHNMPKYKFGTQVQIVIATMAIHNFIRWKSKSDDQFKLYEDENIVVDEDDNRVAEDLSMTAIVVSSR